MQGRRATLLVFCGPILFLLSATAYPQSTPQFDSLLDSARQAQARNDFLSAADRYRQAIKLHPEIPELHANLGLMCYQSGDDQEAIEAFRQAIRRNPKLLVPNLFLGLEYVKLKRFKDAIPYLQRTAATNPKDTQARLGLGEAYAGIGDTRRAISSYLQATQLNEKNADIWYRLGITYLAQVEADARVLLTKYRPSGPLEALIADNYAEQRAVIQADEAYKKALTFPVFPLGAHASYGFLLLDRRDFAGAERELQTEIAANPGSLLAKLGLAKLHHAQGSTEMAAKGIEQIWNTDSGFLVANAQRFASVLTRAQLSELQQTLEQHQASGNVSEELVVLFQSGGSLDKTAERDLAAKPQMSSGGKQTVGNIHELYVGGKYRQCSELLSFHLASLQAQGLRELAFCSFSTGDYRLAFAAAEKMAATVGTEAEGLYWEVKSSQKLASQALTRASEMDSGSSKLHVLLGDVYRQQENFPEAEREYRTALAIRSDDAGGLFGLSLTLLAIQDVDQAKQVTKTSLEAHPDDPEFNAVMGEILCAKQDFAAAEPFLRKGLSAKPVYVPHVRGLLAKVYAQTDRTQEALAELKLALPKDKDGSLHYQIGRLYLKVGDRDSAKQAFEITKQLKDQSLIRSDVRMQQGGRN